MLFYEQNMNCIYYFIDIISKFDILHLKIVTLEEACIFLYLMKTFPEAIRTTWAERDTYEHWDHFPKSGKETLVHSLQH